MALPISIEDHVASCYAPTSSTFSSPSRLITHFYVKKMEEEQIIEAERAAASTATDHGHEVCACHSKMTHCTCFSRSHTLFLIVRHLSPGSWNSKSPPILTERWGRPRILPVALIHRQRSLPAGRLSATFQPGHPRGAPQSPHTLPEDAHTHDGRP